jgi:peroxiredoxin
MVRIRNASLYALVGLVLLVSLVLGGCRAKPVPTPVPTRTPAPPTATLAPAAGPGVTAPTVAGPTLPPPPVIGKEAPGFTLESLTGGPVSLSDFRGRFVMLTFFATWCPYCQSETPHMVKVYNELGGQDFEIVAVSLGETKERVEAYQQEYGVPFTLLLDPEGIAANLYYVQSIPLSVFIDENGVILAGHAGALDEEALREALADLMK